MNFDYNEEQQLLADSVRRFLARDYGFEKRKSIVAGAQGWSRETWATLAQMGVTGLPLPAEHGGFGGGAVDLMGVMEAFGEALLLEPFVATVLAARLVARAGSEAQKKAILPPVVQGELRLAFAHTERGARYRLAHVKAEARASGGGWTLWGEKHAVAGAPMAEKLVVSARTPSGIGLFLVEAKDAKLEPQRMLDGTRAADVGLAGTRAEPLGAGGEALAAIGEAVDFATALVCAEAVGAMKFACDTTLEYLKTRRQFGVPIGTFQALQHRMVDMYVACEQARSITCLACSKADHSSDENDRSRCISAAKIKISDSARLISQESVQLHGGMGMTEELKVSHTFRRLTLIAQQFGDAEHHLARFAALDRAA